MTRYALSAVRRWNRHDARLWAGIHNPRRLSADAWFRLTTYFAGLTSAIESATHRTLGIL